MKITRPIKLRTTIIGAGLLLVALWGLSSITYRQTVTEYKDPYPNAVDDELYITTVDYGWPVALYRRKTIDCFCPPASPSYSLHLMNIAAFVAGMGVAAIVLPRLFDSK